uniref:Uncharacterized protein n=1 Tax=Romanomermis culicivorax TaxID=13658 RepID=A0A915K791_ROMCU
MEHMELSSCHNDLMKIVENFIVQRNAKFLDENEKTKPVEKTVYLDRTVSLSTLFFGCVFIFPIQLNNPCRQPSKKTEMRNYTMES